MPNTTEAHAKIQKLQEAIEIRNSKIVDVHSRIERQEQHILRTQRKKERFENHLRRWNRQNRRDLRKIEELEKIVKPKPVPVEVVDTEVNDKGDVVITATAPEGFDLSSHNPGGFSIMEDRDGA